MRGNGTLNRDIHERNSRNGIAMTLVADIWDSWTIILGNSLIIVSCISIIHRDSAVRDSWGDIRDVAPCIKVFISASYKKRQVQKVYNSVKYTSN